MKNDIFAALINAKDVLKKNVKDRREA